MKWPSCGQEVVPTSAMLTTVYIYNIKKVSSAIEESESAGSRWELNTGPLGCPAGALSLSYDNQTTTGLHNPLYAWCVQLRHFSTTCAVRIEDCEGWCLSGCCAQWQNTGCTSRPGFDSKRPSAFSLSLISLQSILALFHKARVLNSTIIGSYSSRKTSVHSCAGYT